MATYYVRTTGSDVAAGTTPATAWKTIQRAVGASGAGDGDTVYVGGGTYRITATISFASRGAMTYLVGDTDGSQTGDAGEVLVTNYGANDRTAPNAVTIFTLTNANYWTFRNLSVFSGVLTSAVYGWDMNGTSQFVTIENCTYLGVRHAIVLSNNANFGYPANLTIDRCRFYSGAQACVTLSMPVSATGADQDQKIVIRNSRLISNSVGTSTFAHAINVIPGGTNTYKSGGVLVANCILAGGNSAVAFSGSFPGQASTTYPITVNNCLILSNNGLTATTAGTIVENHNYFACVTARNNVTAGANSVADASQSWRFSISHERLFGGVLREWGELDKASPLLAFGGTGVPAGDINNNPRPFSGTGGVAAAIGPYERENVGLRESSTVPPAAGEALRIKGPGSHDFQLAVGSNATTIGVQARYDSAYAGILPQLWVVNGGEAGVSSTSNTMTAAANTWQKITVGPFTPTSNGIVTVRLQSLSTGSNSNAYFGGFTLE